MKPLWKQVFDAAEQTAAPIAAEITASAAFADFMKAATRINRDMNRNAEALTRQLLHRLNLPAAGDLSYLKRQIGTLEAEIRSLRRLIEEQAVAGASPASTPATKATKTTKTTKRAATTAKNPNKRSTVAQ